MNKLFFKIKYISKNFKFLISQKILKIKLFYYNFLLFLINFYLNFIKVWDYFILLIKQKRNRKNVFVKLIEKRKK